MRLHDKISIYIGELYVDQAAASKILGLLFQMDALLSAYYDSMSFRYYNSETGEVKSIPYWIKKSDIDYRLSCVDVFSSNDRKEFLLIFKDYLQLLDSCFNVIGLAPVTRKRYDDPDSK